MIQRADVERLIRHQGKPLVTITMPANVPSLAVRQDAIRLGNLVDAAASRLLAQGYEENEIAPVLEPARKLVGDIPFWAGGRRGLAIFLSPGFNRVFDFDVPLEEEVCCGEHFHISPLLSHLTGPETEFFVLAVAADRTALYRADRQGMRAENVDLPPGVGAVAGLTSYEQTVQAAPISGARAGAAGLSGQAGGVPKGQALGPSPEELRKSQLMQYLNQLAGAVKAAVASSRAPLVLAAQPEVAGNFRKQSEIANLVPQHVDINPWAVDVPELHRLAWQVVAPRFADASIGKAIDHFNSLQGTPRASTELGELVKAARWGRMDTLILGQGQHRWGRFDEQADLVEAHTEPAPTDEDLLDLAAQLTLVNGGEVKVVPRDQVPGGAPAAGIMRF